MTNKEGEELYKRTLSELRDTIISLPDTVWVREVFCDYTEGYPGKEYINVYEMTVREFDIQNGYHMSQLQRYLLYGWRKLDPIEYTDGGPNDVPTYYKPYKENQFYLAFILDYDPNSNYKGNRYKYLGSPMSQFFGTIISPFNSNSYILRIKDQM